MLSRRCLVKLQHGFRIQQTIWTLLLILLCTTLLFTFYTKLPEVTIEESSEILSRISANRFRPTLLLWTSVWREVPDQAKLAEIDCFGTKIACDIATDRRTVQEAAALIFHGRDVAFYDMPMKKYIGQPWVLWNQEPPVNSPTRVYEQARHLFDMELSYRRNSEISAPYGFFTRNKPAKQIETWDELEKRFKQQSGAVWVVSACSTESRREDYVRELQKYFPVDVYGSCGDHVCPKTAKDSCMEHLSHKHMFYLAFENSICPDYVTEKLYRTLRYPIIPVVMTGTKDRFLDSLHAFVNASQFTPRALALKLNEISQNITQYAEYFEWKKTFTAHNQMHPLCRICDTFLKQAKRPTAQKSKLQTFPTDRMNHKACKTWNSHSQEFQMVEL